MLEPVLDLEDITPDGLRRLSRSEYHQLTETGEFDDDDVELLRGLLVVMTKESWLHATLVAWLTRRINLGVDDSYEVRPGLPFAASDYSEPKPDIFVAKVQRDRRAHPTDALLLIEISNTSIRKDRRVKLPIYAEAAVPEYWIIDITAEGTIAVEVYTEPTASGYARVTTLRDGDILRPLHVPIEIAVADVPR